MSDGQDSDHAEKIKKTLKPILGFIGVLVFCLSIAGIAEAANTKIAKDLFITILFFTVLLVFIYGFYLLVKHSGYISKYEINQKSGKSPKAKKEKANGVENGAFADDLERGPPAAQNGEQTEEKWVKNYVEYEAEATDTVQQEDETDGEEKRREEEKGEKENMNSNKSRDESEETD